DLTDNKLSPYRVSIDVKVTSGINWFNATHDVRFGRRKVSLKKIQAALSNKLKYVVLDDGTKGILPPEWLAKFSAYFQAGEVVDDETVRFATANFETVAALYDQAELDAAAAAEIDELRNRIKNFSTIQHVPVPKGLTVT